MWIQSMAVQPASAVGKGSQGAQRNGTAAAAETDFAAWLDASMNRLEEASPGTSAASVEKSGVFAPQENLTEETLLNVLQEWLAAAIQFTLSGESSEETRQESLEQETSPLEAKFAEQATVSQPDMTALLTGIVNLNADSTAGRTENGDIQQQLQQLLRYLSTMQDMKLFENVSEPDAERLFDTLAQWLHAARQQSVGSVSDYPVDGLVAPPLKGIRSDVPSSGSWMTIFDMPTVGGEKTESTPLGNVRGILVREWAGQMGHRFGMRQDGGSGGAFQENNGLMQPIVNGGPTQGAAGMERPFGQWLTESVHPEAPESNPTSPARDLNPVFPTVRIAMSRFETLDGRGYEARFQLYPEHLGTVHVKLVFHQGALQAHLVVDTRMAKEALESQLHSLQQAFAQQGLQVDKIQVTVREEALFQWQEHNAFLFQEQRQHARQDAQGGQASGSANAYITAETEDSENETATVLRGESSLKEGIDLSV